jgi:site-specific DNA-methyltransferase (adenine-specific)
MFPGTVMEVSKAVRKNETDEKIEHMTVKPICLISHLIKLFTKTGQTVLDPFLGSGSHGVAAIESDRKFMGFEIEKKYYDIASRRIESSTTKRERLSSDNLKAGANQNGATRSGAGHKPADEQRRNRKVA